MPVRFAVNDTLPPALLRCLEEIRAEAPARSDRVTVLKALADEVRLDILDWLRFPRQRLEPHAPGDLTDDGVKIELIRRRLGRDGPTAARQLAALVEAGLVVATAADGSMYYRRDEVALHRALDRLRAEL